MSSLVDFSSVDGFGKWRPGKGNYEKFEETGAGLFPDRLISAIAEKKGELVKEVISKAKEDVGKLIGDQKFARQYFQAHYVIRDIVPGENIIQIMDAVLDARELGNTYPAKQDDKDPLADFMYNVNSKHDFIKWGFSDYIRKAHPKLDIKKFGFDSIVEISTREWGFSSESGFYEGKLQNLLEKLKTIRGKTERVEEDVEVPKPKQEAISEEEFIQELAKKDFFKTNHKYVTIVYADGDNMGKTIGEIGSDPQRVAELSAIIAQFAAEAAVLIKNYGGTPVYAGGDDLLFFAPVSMFNADRSLGGQWSSNSGRHVLDLLEELDERFKKLTKEKKFEGLSLSFGVSVTYYKYPMNESLGASYAALSKAKSIDSKNGVSFNLQKHSGGSFGGTWSMQGSTFRSLQNILSGYATGSGQEGDVLKGVTYTLRNQLGLLKRIAGDVNQVTNFFKNTFNESVHLDQQLGSDEKKLKPYLLDLARLIPQLYEENPKDFEENLFGVLRTASFILGEMEE